MPMPNESKMKALHYLFTRKQRDRFIAHCLDFDLVVGAPTPEEAENRLDAMVKAYIEGAIQSGNFAALATPAPDEYWRDFQGAMRDGHAYKPQRPTLQIRVSDAQADRSFTILAAAA